jgi:hypothetical protein
VCPGRETAPGFFHIRDPPPGRLWSRMKFEKGQSQEPPPCARCLFFSCN